MADPDLSSANFRLVFESSPAREVILTPDFRIVAASDAYLNATMTRRSEIVGRSLFEVFPENPDDPMSTGIGKLRTSLDRVRAERVSDTIVVQYNIRRPEAEGGGFEERFWSSVNSPVLSPEGAVLNIVLRVEDVTELVQLKQTRADRERFTEADRARLAEVQEVLRATEERFRLLADGVKGVAIVMLDRDGNIISWSPSARALHGYTDEEVIGRNISLLYTDEDVARGRPRVMLQSAITDGRFESEGWRVRKDGTRFLASVIITALRSKAGGLIGLGKVTRDVTEQRRAEDELRQSEERFRLLVDGVSDYAILMVDPGGHVVSWNSGAERLLGYKSDEILGRHLSVFWPPDDPAEKSAAVALETATGQGRFDGEGWRVRKDGSRFYAKVGITALRDPDGALRGFANVTNDVTERFTAAERDVARLTALEQDAAAFVDSLFANAPIGLAFLDTDLRYRKVNSALTEVNGLSAEQHLGHTIRELFPSYAPLLDPLFRHVIETGSPVVNQEVSGETPAAPGKHRHWLTSYYPVRQRLTGRILGIGLIVVEVTELKDVEERRRRAEAALHETEERRRAVEQASRIKSEFLANMSHELRTPLNAIIGFATLMHGGTVGPVSPDHREYLGDILTSAAHLLQLINDVLDLSKVEAGKMDFDPRPMDLSTIVGEVRDVLKALAAQKRIAIELDIDPGVRSIVADPSRLRQILYNYLSNALKFTPDGGRVLVRAAPEGVDRFRLEVQDTGIGIAPGDLDRLFVEFQQLDQGAGKRHQGTGLGLILTKRLAAAQGGEVGVRSMPGEGSAFFVVLPRKAGRTGASAG